MPRPSDEDDVLFVEVTRSGLVESNHRGALAVVDSEGGLLAAAGDPHYVAYLRSAAKPFQALPTVAAGALDHFGLDEEALALMCASHHGTEAHVAIDQRILDAIGLDKSALRCGVHWPIDELDPLRQPPITNHRHQVVGEIRSVFALTRFNPPQPLPEER